jgi:hypothetical protein
MQAAMKSVRYLNLRKRFNSSWLRPSGMLLLRGSGNLYPVIYADAQLAIMSVECLRGFAKKLVKK